MAEECIFTDREETASDRSSRITVRAETNVPTLAENDEDGFTRIVLSAAAASDWMVMLQGGKTVVDCAVTGRKTVDVPDHLELRFYGAEDALAIAAAFIDMGRDLARQTESNLLGLDHDFTSIPTFLPQISPTPAPLTAAPFTAAPFTAAPLAAAPLAAAPAAFFPPPGAFRLEVLSRTRAGLKRAAMMLPVAAATAAVVHAGTVTGAAGGNVTASASGYPTNGGDDSALSPELSTDPNALASAPPTAARTRTTASGEVALASLAIQAGFAAEAPASVASPASKGAAPVDSPAMPGASSAPTPTARVAGAKAASTDGNHSSVRSAEISGMQPVWPQERNRVWLPDTRKSPIARLRAGFSRLFESVRGLFRRS